MSKLKTFKDSGLSIDGHSIRRRDGSILCVADSPRAAEQLATALEACHLILPMLRECGYGGRNTTAERRHQKLLESIIG